MTALQQRCIKAIEAWCKKRGLKLLHRPCHVYPRAYVVVQTAPRCLIVAQPWADSEPQTRDWNQKYPFNSLHTFDESLTAGMWCTTAYIQREGCGESIAIPVVE